MSLHTRNKWDNEAKGCYPLGCEVLMAVLTMFAVGIVLILFGVGIFILGK